MTMVELYDGLKPPARTGFPVTVRRDGGCRPVAPVPLPGLLQDLMWPAAFWEKLYEPWIRRAAGRAVPPAWPILDSYEAMHAHCDVLVVGGGAAGLAAARVAGAAGRSRDPVRTGFLPGGGLLAERPHEQWRERALAALSAMPR